MRGDCLACHDSLITFEKWPLKCNIDDWPGPDEVFLRLNRLKSTSPFTCIGDVSSSDPRLLSPMRQLIPLGDYVLAV